MPAMIDKSFHLDHGPERFVASLRRTTSKYSETKENLSKFRAAFKKVIEQGINGYLAGVRVRMQCFDVNTLVALLCSLSLLFSPFRLRKSPLPIESSLQTSRT